MGLIAAIFGFVLLIGGIFAWQYYQAVYEANVPKNLSSNYVHIPNGSSFEQVVDSLEQNGLLINTESFRKIAEQMNYVRPEMRAGRYEIKAGWSNYKLIRHLRGGEQATVKLVLNNERLPENVAAKAALFIEADSLSIWELMQDSSYLKKIGYTPETLISLFIPNTYDFYWNSSPEIFMERMQTEHDRFWESENRRTKAARLDMSPAEVYTLASIVERETLRADERSEWQAFI